jgi:neutral ceramidase
LRLRRLLPLAPLLLLLVTPSPAHAGQLRAGVGKADIQPPTGYFMMGWVRGDAKTVGQHTRLFARVLVLERDGHKVALVAEDLNGIPGGMLKDAANLVKDRGFSEQNVLDSASHTHAAQSGYYNFGDYNTVFPSMATITDPKRIFNFNLTNTAPDPVLYTFMVKQLAKAIGRADNDLGPARLGWGEVDLLGTTRNRSIEAHLADHGVFREPGQGSDKLDPLGYRHTIDPEVNVLRVDKIKRKCVGRRRPRARPARRKRRPTKGKGRDRCPRRKKVRVPIGAWSTFADHGTVNQYQFSVYNRDHHGSAIKVFEDTVRRAGKVPRSQEVLNVYGNTDEGDQSAGLDHNGPAFADEVGRKEADAMYRAWRQAGRGMTGKPTLDWRWTRLCFCGQQTEGGKVDSTGVIGLPQFTGSEEGRGPLYDETHESFEGRRGPGGDEAQEHKIQVVRDNSGGLPKAVPLLAIRVRDRVIVSVPGEMTAEMGRRVRGAVLGAIPPGARVSRVVISGLANEYLSYFTTPEEYDRQHYEGGATLYGQRASNLLKKSLEELTRRLVGGRPAPAAYPYDPKNGFGPGTGSFGAGAASGKAVQQPSRTRRLEHAVFIWKGGLRGEDRPVDRAFVAIQRRVRGTWRPVTDDLGLQILWTVDSSGVYRAKWEIPASVHRGRFRFLITANRYRLASQGFRVGSSRALKVEQLKFGGNVWVRINYPVNVLKSSLDAPFTWHQPHAKGGLVKFRIGNRTKTVRRRKSEVFSVSVPPGTPVSILPRGARDSYGNFAGTAVRLR